MGMAIATRSMVERLAAVPAAFVPLVLDGGAGGLADEVAEELAIVGDVELKLVRAKACNSKSRKSRRTLYWFEVRR